MASKPTPWQPTHLSLALLQLVHRPPRSPRVSRAARCSEQPAPTVSSMAAAATTTPPTPVSPKEAPRPCQGVSVFHSRHLEASVDAFEHPRAPCHQFRGTCHPPSLESPGCSTAQGKQKQLATVVLQQRNASVFAVWLTRDKEQRSRYR